MRWRCKTKLDEMAAWRADAQQQFREAAELADRHYRLGAVPVTIYVEMQTRATWTRWRRCWPRVGEARNIASNWNLLVGPAPGHAYSPPALAES